MSSPSPQTSPADCGAYDAHMQPPYLLVPMPGTSADLYAREIDLSNHPWMVATVIEDNDIMFGGKPLSAWYEEDRQQSMGSEADLEEQHRGRQRERPRSDPHYHHSHHHHHGHHKHGKVKKEGK